MIGALWNTAWSAFYSSDAVKFISVISDISYFSCFVIIIAKAVLPLFHLPVYVIDENLDIGVPESFVGLKISLCLSYKGTVRYLSTLVYVCFFM